MGDLVQRVEHVPMRPSSRVPSLWLYNDRSWALPLGQPVLRTLPASSHRIPGNQGGHRPRFLRGKLKLKGRRELVLDH